MKKILVLLAAGGVAAGITSPTAWSAVRSGQATGQQSANPPTLSGQQPAGQAAKPNPAGQPAAQPAPYKPTQDEVKDFKAVQNELDPNRVLQLMADYEKKYPTSPFLTDVYFFAANSSRESGHLDKAIEYAEKSVKVNGNNLRSLMTLADLLPQPQALQHMGDADRDKKLAEAETDGERALTLIPNISKQGDQTDEQLTKNKAILSAGVHGALGLVHLQRAMEGLSGADPAELAKAETEYKAAVAVDKPDESDYFRLGEVLQDEGKTADAIQAFTKASQVSQSKGNSALQNMADQEVQKLKQAKPAPKP